MSKGITLDDKFGLAPAISQCFICGNDKNELVLFGNKHPKDYKEYGSNKYVTSLEPCDECKEKYLKNGVLLVEADENNITGSFAVIKDEAFKRIFDCDIPEHKICYVEIGILEKLGVK